jgi:hypothetical protein
VAMSPLVSTRPSASLTVPLRILLVAMKDSSLQ